MASTNLVYDDWKYNFNDCFAQGFIGKWRVEFDSLLNSKPPTQCCTRCGSVLFYGGDIDFSELCTAGKGCQLCDLILRTVKRYNSDGRDVKVCKIGPALTMKHNGHRILRLCSDLGSSARSDSDYNTQISFPVFPAADGPLRFALLRAWLQWCDEHTRCKYDDHEHDNEPREGLPTRLLYVGNPNSSDYNPDVLRLVSSQQIGAGKYVALSHCWGELKPNEVPRYCTTQENIGDRQVGFGIADLPLTFRDAVMVARGLEVQYLWIDSLCIIQGKDGDWEQESKRMEDVYTSAYCTVAATSAVDSNAGFLKRNISSEYVYVQDDSGRRVYVCTDLADFDKEVEGRPLNTRAWVMQERLLSRRTIHFGDSQVYWECGEGVYCEDLTQLKSTKGKKKHFMLDPKFPSLLFNSGYDTTRGVLQSFLVDYSKRGLSKPTDRVVALSGLAARIAKALRCEERYGIFNLYLHRNLLWRRSSLHMIRIKYEPLEVPSWSWMAYTGGIEFMDDHHLAVEVFKNLSFAEWDKKALITNVWEFRDCHLKKEEAESDATGRQILDSRGTKIGWIMYDVKDGENGKDLCWERGVVVKKTYRSNEYHILIVRQSAENEYERVGIGTVQQDYLSRQQPNVRIL
ncbi:hypothetical protein B7463_g7054, partial [Scytalidium lignicola]